MLGDTAQFIRKKLGLTQLELGLRWNKSRVQIGRYERNGENLPPIVADAYKGLEFQLKKGDVAMKTIFFPGNNRIPSMAHYAVFHNPSGNELISTVNIVAMQYLKSGTGSPNYGTSLFNTDEGRDVLLNRILETELGGIRLEFIRFFVIIGGAKIDALEFPIKIDVDDYRAKRNPFKVETSGGIKSLLSGKHEVISFSSVDVVAGCAKVITSFAESKSVDESDARDLLKLAGAL